MTSTNKSKKIIKLWNIDNIYDILYSQVGVVLPRPLTGRIAKP
jgi:hypothetical protein